MLRCVCVSVGYLSVSKRLREVFSNNSACVVMLFFFLLTSCNVSSKILMVTTNCKMFFFEKKKKGEMCKQCIIFQSKRSFFVNTVI